MSATWKTLNQAIRHFHRETSFADPTRTRDRDQADVLTQQEFFNGSNFFFPTHKPGSLHRKIRRARRYLLKWLLREAVPNGRKFPCEIAGRDVALVGFFRQAPFNRPTHRSGRVTVLPCNRFRRFPKNRHQGLRCGASLKGAFSGHHLVEHQAERELVFPENPPIAAALFRWPVSPRRRNQTP